MNISLLTFDIIDVGGIDTVRKNLKIGLQRLGHQVTDYFVSYNVKKLPTKPSYDKSIGFMTTEFLSQFKREMLDKDLLIFVNQSPTKTKSFDSDKWMELYKTGKPNISIVHDPLFERHYKWFLDVKPYITGVACIQQCAYRIMSKYFDDVITTNHFLDLSDMGLYDNLKEDLVICPHVFKKWKHIDLFIRAIPEIRYSIEVYSDGIERKYMTSKEKCPDDYKGIWNNALDHGMKYFGFVDDSVIKQAFKRAKVIPDLSTGMMGTTLTKDDPFPNQLKQFPKWDDIKIEEMLK